MERKRRMDALLKGAALEFENGRNPFDTEWLAANKVTLEECFSLSERIAIVIKGYLASPEAAKDAILMVGAME